MPDWIAWAVDGVFGVYVAFVLGREFVKARRARHERERLRAEWAVARAEEIQWQRKQRLAESARRENEAAPGSAN